ncbi:MAG: DinB family protein [Phycisphaerae bacterium]
MDIKTALKSQYHAALAMLRQAIERCPEALWTAGGHPSPYWQIAYHTLFFTHLYLQPNEEAFSPWEHHREEYQFLEALPWPPHDRPNIREPYTASQVTAYWQVCDAMIDAGVDRLDLDAADCGFSWYDISKLEHQIMNVRHIQHHAAQLADRLRSAADIDLDWIGGQPPNE